MTRQGRSDERDGSGENKQSPAESEREFFDNEKTLKIRVSDLGLPPNATPNTPAATMLDVRPVQPPGLSVLPFREGAPARGPVVSSGPGALPSSDFTGTVTLSRDEQFRAEFQQAIPFAKASTPMANAPAAPAVAPAAPFAMAGLPDAFRAHLSPAVAAAPAPRTIGEAAVAGGFALSNAALQPTNTAKDERVQIAEVLPAQTLRDPIVLVYLDRASLPRIARKPAWQKILDAMDDEPIDPEADDPALSSDPSEIQDQAQVYAILKQGQPLAMQAAQTALETAAAKGGRFAPPIEMFEGDVEPMFDELEQLRSLISVMTPLVKGQEKLERALTDANQWLQTAGAVNMAPMARRQRSELRAAWQSAKPAMPFDEIHALVVRGMLEDRKYQKARVLGGEHLCARFFVWGNDEPQLVYIPAEAAPFLPLSQRFFTRTIAAIHFAQDDQETSSMAWRCLALGHIVRRQRRI